jgi:hypothetical protein
MEENVCVVCGIKATLNLFENPSLPVCDNIVCHHDAVETIKSVLELNEQPNENNYYKEGC